MPWVLGLILLAGFLLRVLLLSQFPQAQADEGLWTTSTKNFLLFGDWFMDERNHLFLSPVFHLLSLGPFAVLGPSVESARLLSALAGTGSILLVYLLGIRLTGNAGVAVVAAAVLAFDPWAVIASRQAMTEAVLLFFILAAAVLVLGNRRALVWAGVLFALAILTKLNAGAMGIALGGYLLLRDPPDGSEARWRDRAVDGAVFGVTALGLAALGYWAISFVDPERFVAVFQRELGGDHVTPDGAGARVGRIGLDPVFAGRNLLELLRTNPFLFSFAALGGVVLWAARMRGRLFLGLWVAVAIGVPLFQVYQPVRYFFPVVPALVILVGVLAMHLRSEVREAERAALGVTTIILAFSVAYLSMNFVANRGDAPSAVERWARQHTDPNEPLLMAAYLATNPPNPAYAHDLAGGTEAGLDEVIRAYGIRYVIWDVAEWSVELREVLDRRFTRVETWPFGAAYRVDGPAPTDPEIPVP